eukprot:NODE_608_length_6066_cov_0.184347.p4 type:complete len:122 gc:universal NODE_608_length_6066_cov_0.184347:613-978(+)
MCLKLQNKPISPMRETKDTDESNSSRDPHSLSLSISSSDMDWESNPAPVYESPWNAILNLNKRKIVSNAFSYVFGTATVALFVIAMIFRNQKIISSILWISMGTCLILTTSSVVHNNCYRK